MAYGGFWERKASFTFLSVKIWEETLRNFVKFISLFRAFIQCVHLFFVKATTNRPIRHLMQITILMFINVFERFIIGNEVAITLSSELVALFPHKIPCSKKTTSIKSTHKHWNGNLRRRLYRRTLRPWNKRSSYKSSSLEI